MDVPINGNTETTISTFHHFYVFKDWISYSKIESSQKAFSQKRRLVKGVKKLGTNFKDDLLQRAFWTTTDRASQWHCSFPKNMKNVVR